MGRPEYLLAFVHIEKAAGTTFIHVLRRCFFGGYLDVRPLTTKGPNDVFGYEDFRIYKRINPMIRCIAGHSVRPFSDLGERLSDVRYVALLREPSERYVSQFIYWNNRLDRRFTFPQFLALASEHNFQTKKICGEADWGKAASLLRENFFCIGLLERFNEFLVTLAGKLGIPASRLRYEKQNIGAKSGDQASGLLDRYRAEIRAVNEQDYELYRFIQEEILPQQSSEYGDVLDRDVRAFLDELDFSPALRLKTYLDWTYRKYYVEPVTNLIRRRRGLPAKGSYARS